MHINPHLLIQSCSSKLGDNALPFLQAANLSKLGKKIQVHRRNVNMEETDLNEKLGKGIMNLKFEYSEGCHLQWLDS